MAEAKDGVTEIGSVLALLLFASVAGAQNAPAPAAGAAATAARVATPEATAQTATAASASEKPPAGPPKISYAGGQLKIDALDSTLRDVLTQVAALTGMKIDMPAGASNDPLPVVKLGPGPARQILASLLSKSEFDYVILASAADPEGIQKVVLMPREKRGSTGAEPAARPSRGPYAAAVAPPVSSEETPEPISPVLVQPDNTVAQTSPSTPAPTQPDPSTQTVASAPLSPAAALSNRSGLTTEGAMNPPSSMDSQSINQQLLQMYQQRAQITQPASANPQSH